MIFTAPYYLIALLGILVPIAIHLWNRKRGRVIKVGSIKLLAESDTHKMSSLKISEWFLMFLRISLIVLLVLLMSGLHALVESTSESKVVILIDKEYYHNPNYHQIIDSLDALHEMRFFQNGFPLVDDRTTLGDQTDYWTLISHLDQLTTDSIVIYSPLKLSKFNSQYYQLPNHATWIPLPEEMQMTFIDKAYWHSEDSLQLVIGVNIDDLKFDKLIISLNNETMMGKETHINLLDSTVWLEANPNDKIKIEAKPSISIGIYTSDEYLKDLAYFEAAFEALNRYDIAEFSIEKYEKDKVYEMIVWLSNEGYSTLSGEQVILKLDEDSDAEKLITKSGDKLYSLAHRANPFFSSEARVLELPDALISLLNDAFLTRNKNNKKDKRLLDVSQLYTASSGLDTASHTDVKSRTEKIDQWFWLIFLALLLIERGVSLIKKT